MLFSGLLSKNISAPSAADSTGDKPIKHEDKASDKTSSSSVEESATNRKLVEFKQQVDLLDIQGYNGQSVKILFEYLKGYNLLIEEFDKLVDMLLFCNSYDIQRDYLVHFVHFVHNVWDKLVNHVHFVHYVKTCT